MLKEPLLPLGEDFKGNRDEKNLEENAFLLYSPENSQNSNIPMEIVKNIFEEAQTIIRSVNGIVEMPGYEDRSSLFVLNISHPKDPFKVVKLKSTRFFTCEKRCNGFQVLNCAAIRLLQNIVTLLRTLSKCTMKGIKHYAHV